MVPHTPAFSMGADEGTISQISRHNRGSDLEFRPTSYLSCSMLIMNTAKTTRRRQIHSNDILSCGLRRIRFNAPWICRLVILFVIYIWMRHKHVDTSNRTQNQQQLLLSTEKDRCWLQEAFQRGNFLVGSHRSLGDSQLSKQPSCLEGLHQLYIHNIHYLDLDLIYDPATLQLVVAHPMEFQGTTQVYSPCANQPLEIVIQLLDQTMQRSWSVSLEPKADWDRTQDNSILQPPILLLEQILKVVEKSQLESTQCSLIIDTSKVQSNEMPIVAKLAQYCSFSFAMRRNQGVEIISASLQQQTTIFHYEYLMPTIEFHPTHPNYQATTGMDSLRAVQQTVDQCIYWTVDTRQDLERAAMLRATGIVSNQPLKLVQCLTEDPSWCSQKQLRTNKNNL